LRIRSAASGPESCRNHWGAELLDWNPMGPGGNMCVMRPPRMSCTLIKPRKSRRAVRPDQ
jgi:hypothetical protein